MIPIRRLVPAGVASLLVVGCAALVPEASRSPTPAASTVPASELRAVGVAELAVGTRPGDSSNLAVADGLLMAGDLVWVLETANDAGSAWHLVARDGLVDELHLPFGWVRAEADGAPTLVAPDLACPTSPPSVTGLAGLGRFGGLACYGARPIELIGFTPTGCGAGGSPRTGSPEWLNGTWTGVGIGAREPTQPDFDPGTQLVARAAPTGELPAGCGSPAWLRFRGHFDDPAASTCRTEVADGAGIVVVEPALSELLCRAELVISGADPVADR